MICSNCGFETAENEQFCPRCGTAFPVAEPAESQSLRFSSSLRQDDSIRGAGQWAQAADLNASTSSSRKRDYSANIPATDALAAERPVEAVATRYCHMCGASLTDTTTFCPNCGARLNEPAKSLQHIYSSKSPLSGASNLAEKVKILSFISVGISLLLVILWFCNFISFSIASISIGGVSAHEMLGRFRANSDGLDVEVTTIGIIITALSVVLLLASAAASLLPVFLGRKKRRWMFVLQVVHASIFVWWVLGLMAFASELSHCSLTFGAILMLLLGIAQIPLLCVTYSKSKKIYN